MKNKVSKRNILLLLLYGLFSLGLTRCPVIPDTDDVTGTLSVNIDDNYT